MTRGCNLKAVREMRGMSVEEVAWGAKIGRDIIWLLEGPRVTTTHPNIALRIAKVLGLTLEDTQSLCAKKHEAFIKAKYDAMVRDGEIRV